VRLNITNATLFTQIVEPGAYIELQDAAFTNNWNAVPMQRATTKPDEATFLTELPGTLQKHRRLIRYRLRVQDSTGKTYLAPGFDQTPPNQAYFVYDGIPAWSGATDPRSSNTKMASAMTFPAEVMQRVQTYHLIGKRRSIENATWREHNPGKDYKYTGTLIVDGEVFDHIGYRARGGVWRYAMGKNMWKFLLPGDHDLQAKNDFGHPYPAQVEQN
jgi:hypothetical protein